MRIFWMVLALCLTIAKVEANDSGIDGVGGRLRVLRGEHRSLRMVSERVQMDIFAKFYDVQADFIFRNEGAVATVQMGFPESGYGDYPCESMKKSAFKTFVTSVDGRRVAAWRAVVQSAGDGETYQTFWVKMVSFGRHQTRRVRVSYRANLGEGIISRGIGRFAVYQFTGGNWRSKVDVSRLMIRLRAPGTHVIKTSFANKSLIMQRKGTTFSHTWRNWQAQGDFSFNLSSTLPGWLDDGNGPFDANDAIHQSVTVPHGASTAVEYAPPAVLRDGVTFIALRDLQRILAARAEREKEGLSEQEVKLSWDAKSHSSRLTAGPHSFEWQPGSYTMKDSFKGRINGGQKLDEPPFVAGVQGGQQLYVPLVTVASTLGATVKVDAAHHHFSMQVPDFLEPR